MPSDELPWYLEAAKYAVGGVGGILLAGLFHPLGEWAKELPRRVAAGTRRRVATMGRALWLGSSTNSWLFGDCVQSVRVAADGHLQIRAGTPGAVTLHLRLENPSPLSLRVTVERVRICGQWQELVVPFTAIRDLHSEFGAPRGGTQLVVESPLGVADSTRLNAWLGSTKTKNPAAASCRLILDCHMSDGPRSQHQSISVDATVPVYRSDD